MASGTITLSNSSATSGGGWIEGKIEWSSTQNTAANTSTVTATLFCRKGGSTSATWGYWSCSLNVGGTTVSGSPQLSILDWTQVASQTVTVAHDADGTKAITLTGAVSAPSGTSYAGKTASGSGTATLDTIPRASDFTISGSEFGSPVTVSITRASPSFTHIVYYKRTDNSIGNYWTGIGTSLTFTPSLSDCTLLPNATSGTASLLVETYSGNTLVGSCTRTFPLYVPSSVAPVISAFSVSPTGGNNTTNGWGIYVRGISKASWTTAAAGPYGAYIASYSFSFAGVTGSGSDGTSGILTAAGSQTPTMTITDSRGRSASMTLSAVTVYDYAPPSLSGASAIRCTADGTAASSGTCLKLTLTAACTSLGGRNSVSLRYRYKASGGSYSGYSVLQSGMVISGFPATASYTVELSALDALGYEKTVEIAVPTDAVAFHLKSGGKGAAFGKYAETENLLESAWPLKIQGSTLSDFVAETGTSGIWKYLKWKSGTVLCWGQASGSITNGYATGTFPFTLSGPRLQASWVYSNQNSMRAILSTQPLENGHWNLYFRDANENPITGGYLVDLFVIGTIS